MSGIYALSEDRLLVWAIGHNVYDPLTVYDARTGATVTEVKMPGFATDALRWDGLEDFITVSDQGKLERRSVQTGKRLEALGKLGTDDSDWPSLHAVAGGEGLIATSDSNLLVLRRTPKGKYKLAISFEMRGVLTAHVRSQHFALVAENIEVFTSAGMRAGVLSLKGFAPDALADASTRAVLGADDRLLLVRGRCAAVVNLDSGQVRRQFTLSDDVTAVAAVGAHLVLGTASGGIVRLEV